jgi:acetyltransferase-like isoleucine patch superfamily enzyme
MRLLRRGFSRLLLYGFKALCIPLETVSPRRYMQVYTRLLTHFGMTLKGQPRYIASKSWFDDYGLITLGDRVVVSKNVTFLTHDYVVTTALRANGMAPPTDIAIRKPISVGNNVFIGLNSVILPGCVIEDNVVIGAGAVVRGHVPEGSIVIGNPGTVIGSLMDSPDKWVALSQGPLASRDKS